MSDSIFSNGEIYNLLYSEKNYQEEVNYISTLIKKFDITGKRLLEFGSGTGKHAKFFVKLGYSVHGIEYSNEMISKIEKIKGFTFQQGDIANVFLDQKFDVVISLFHVMCYQTENENIEKVFKNANQHLNPGGLFIFDFWFTPAVFNQFPKVKFKNVKNKKIEVWRIAEPIVNCNEDTVDVNYTFFVKNIESKEIESFKESHKMRHFKLSEIDLFCKISGFKRVLSVEFLTNNPLNENTWHAVWY